MSKLKVIFLLFTIIQLSYGVGIKAGPIGFYDIIDVQTCKCPNGCKGTLNLFIAKDGNTKYVNGNFTLPTDFDESYTFKLNIDRWSGSEWKKDIYKLSGPACENMLKIGPNIYDNVMSKLRPEISPKKCFVPAGTYTAEKIQSKASDVKLPSLMYGKYRGTVMLYKGTEELTCLHTTLEAAQ